MAGIIKFTCIIAILAAACSPQAAGNDATHTELGTRAERSAKVARIQGWQSLRFGMTFDEALTAEANIRWYGIAECQEEMALEGCLLPHDRTGSYVPLMAGVNLSPLLSFNRMGSLTDISLMREWEKISQSECESIHSRLADHLGENYGQALETGEQPAVQTGPTRKKTPGGYQYTVRTTGNEFMVADFDAAQNIDGSEINLLTTYITVEGTGRCYTNVGFHGPKKLERAPLKKTESVEKASR